MTTPWPVPLMAATEFRLDDDDLDEDDEDEDEFDGDDDDEDEDEDEEEQETWQVRARGVSAKCGFSLDFQNRTA